MEKTSYNVTLTQEEIDFIYLVTGYVIFNHAVAPNASKTLVSLADALEGLVSDKNKEAYHKLTVNADLSSGNLESFDIVFKEDI